MEVWKDVKGYEGYYQVSDHGRVKSVERRVKTSYGSQLKRELMLKFDKTKKNKRGQFYFRVAFSKQNKQKRVQVHRLVAKHFIEKVFGKNLINHIDGNPENNHYSNLEWCTNSENIIHAVKNGLCNPNFGEDHHNSKLSNKEVVELRLEIKKGIPYSKLSKKYGISKAAISKIKLNKTYKNI